MESGRGQEELAKSYYEETILMAAILESFVYSLSRNTRITYR